MKILKLYQKPTFSNEDNEIINKAMDEGIIDVDDIKEDCIDYIYQRLGDEGIYIVDISEFTDEHLQNGLTHEENYNNLIDYLNGRKIHTTN